MYRQIGISLILFFIPLYIFSYSLIIVEVQTRGENPSESYIKIYNSEEERKDISGFRLIKKSSTGKEYSIRIFPKESFISAKDYFIWSNSKNDYHISINADVYSTAEISSNNSIALFSKDKDLIDSLAWGSGENQFIMGNPFPFNPQEGELIKRIKKNEVYYNAQDNSKDFYLFPEKEPLKLNQQENIFNLQKESTLPIKEGVSIAITLSFLTLVLKNNLEKYGRT